MPCVLFPNNCLKVAGRRNGPTATGKPQRSAPCKLGGLFFAFSPHILLAPLNNLPHLLLILVTTAAQAMNPNLYKMKDNKRTPKETPNIERWFLNTLNANVNVEHNVIDPLSPQSAETKQKCSLLRLARQDVSPIGILSRFNRNPVSSLR